MTDPEILAALGDSAAKVLADASPVARVRSLIDDGADFDAPLWQQANELGWTILALPEEQGGLGGGIAEYAELQKHIGRSLALLPSISTAIAVRALSEWSADLPAKVLGQLAEGQARVGVADLDARHSFVIDQDGRLSGSGPVLDARGAAYCLLGASDHDGEPILLLIETAGGVLEDFGQADRTRCLDTLSVAGLAIEQSAILKGSAASKVADRMKADAALLVAADSIGGASAILDETVAYLKTRTQFGRPIGSFQALKHRAADCRADLEVCHGLLRRALARDGDASAHSFAAMAKDLATDVYLHIAGEGVQMHGGIGFTWEHPAHLFLKRASLNRAIFGDGATQQDRVAAAVLAA